MPTSGLPMKLVVPLKVALVPLTAAVGRFGGRADGEGVVGPDRGQVAPRNGTREVDPLLRPDVPGVERAVGGAISTVLPSGR